MTETAYVTRDPAAVAAMREAMDAYSAWGSALAPAAEALGKNKGVLGSAGFSTPQVHGLKPDDPSDPPEGWIYRKRQDLLVPRTGKPGEPARAWMQEHCQPPKHPSRVLDEYGMPTCSGIGQNIWRAEITVVADAVHVLHRGGLDNSIARTFSGVAELHERWETEPLSAYHLARETRRSAAAAAS